MIRVVNKSDGTAELYITGDIIDDDDGLFLSSWGEDGGYTFPAQVKAQLDSIKGKDLTIYINSDGGSVPAGVAIASMLSRHTGHTRAVVDGWACSVATQIFFSAKERAIPANAYLMIHKPWINVAGDAVELRKTADILDVLQEGIETTYRKVARDGITDEAIHEMVNAETWLTGEQAAELFDIEVLQPAQMKAKRGRKVVPMQKRPKIDIVDDVEETFDREKAEIAFALALAEGAI